MGRDRAARDGYRYRRVLDSGIELSTGLLRDAFVEAHFGTPHYKDFFAHKRLGDGVGERCAPLFAATGLPTHTRTERIDKLRAVNALYASLTPDVSPGLRAGAETKLLNLRDRA